MNSDIQIIHVLSDAPADCSLTDGSPGDELADTILVTVIALGVAEMVTTVLTVAVFVTDCTSVLVLVLVVIAVVVVVELTSSVLVSDSTLMLVVMVVDVSVVN